MIPSVIRVRRDPTGPLDGHGRPMWNFVRGNAVLGAISRGIFAEGSIMVSFRVLCAQRALIIWLFAFAVSIGVGGCRTRQEPDFVPRCKALRLGQREAELRAQMKSIPLRVVEGVDSSGRRVRVFRLVHNEVGASTIPGIVVDVADDAIIEIVCDDTYYQHVRLSDAGADAD